MEELALICEDSLEGIFTGIYDAYILKKERHIPEHDAIHLLIEEPACRNFYTEYLRCPTDDTKAEKVVRTIRKVCGEDTYQYICQAASTHDVEKADAIYHTVVIGIQFKDEKVCDRLTNRYVRKLFELSRYAGNEFSRLREFLRFQELSSGILFAQINPKCEIVPFLAEHFADRLPNENFVIYDRRHHMFAMHEKYKLWFLVRNQELQEESIVFSEEEEDYQVLFTHFCQKVAITSRKNPTLQRNMLPIRFRADMVEFNTQVQ